MIGRPRFSLRPTSLALAALSALPACGGGPTGPPPPPPASMSFAAAVTPPPANSVTLREANRSSSSLTLEVVATDVNGVASVYFDVVFNPVFVHVTSSAGGPFLGTGGGGVTFTIPANLTTVNAQGRLPVGLAITPAVSGVSGSGVLCTLTFSAQAAGTSGLSFEAWGASTPFPVTPIAGITFSGGAITVVR